MKNMRRRNIIITAALLGLTAFVLNGCGTAGKTESQTSAEENKTTESETQKSADNDAAKSTTGNTIDTKIKITIGTSGAPKPFTYINENNELEGYDIDVVKAIFKELPQYEINFEQTEFPSVLAGLDSDRYQVGANSFAMNEKRKEKYLASNAIFKNQLVIAVAEDRTDINSFNDLKGKSTEVQTGINYTTALERYNETNKDNPVILNYTEADLTNILQNVESGKYDFQLLDQAMLNTYIKEFGLKIKSIKLTDEETKLIGTPNTYLLLSKGQYGEQLQRDINTVLEKLLKDGTIAGISKQYFGDDFSPK